MTELVNTEDLKEYDLIKKAIEKFGVQYNTIEFIRHNENLTLKVDDNYLLRIHKPANSFQAISQYINMDIKKMREAEISFLQHLKRNGINVQIPILSKENIHVVQVSDDIYATMLQWIPGHIIEKNQLTEELCFEIGQLIAQLNKASVGFQNNNTLHYDSNLCITLKACFTQKEMLIGMKEEHRLILENTWEKLSQKLQDNSDFITVHSDLSLSNLLVTNTGLAPIDFSLFGLAHPMMDIGGLFGNINGIENRKALADGYCSMGYKINSPMLDAYFVLSVLLYIVIHIKLCKEEGFQKNIERWCKKIFQPFIQGNRLISDDFYIIHADK